MAQSYKALKEDFVSNLSGGSIWEINFVTAVAPAAVLLWSALQSRQGFFRDHGLTTFLADYLLNVGAILAATTIYSSAPVGLNGLLALPAIAVFLLPASNATNRKKSSTKVPANGVSSTRQQENPLDSLPDRPFITHYRGSMMVVTCIAILAVDFKVFPRRFAKVENWGTSLMDMGVGSFVFSAGLVSARPILKARMAGKSSDLVQSMNAAARHSLPLLALGLLRLYSVKGLDYAEHVTEYGVHWNFFFTLALLPPFAALVQALPTQRLPVHWIALLVGSVFQVLLETTRLKAFILTAPRTDLFSQNREGVFSFAGYLSIFLAGQSIGFDILPRNASLTAGAALEPRRNRQLLTRLLLWSLAWSLLLILTISHNVFGFQVSRRMANLPYILWVSAFNSAQIASFCAIETLAFPLLYTSTDRSSEARKCEKATSKVLGAFNRNSLAIFLLANLLTGLVNLSTNTLAAGQGTAVAILVLYSGFLTAVATTLHMKKISLKL